MFKVVYGQASYLRSWVSQKNEEANFWSWNQALMKLVLLMNEDSDLKNRILFDKQILKKKLVPLVYCLNNQSLGSSSLIKLRKSRKRN